MHATDPLLPYWFFACAALGIAFGYFIGRLSARRRKPASRYWFSQQ